MAQQLDTRTGNYAPFRFNAQVEADLEAHRRDCCDHPVRERRAYVGLDGRTTVHLSCQDCGSRIGEPLRNDPRAQAPPADPALHDAYIGRRKAAYEAIIHRHIDRQRAEPIRQSACYSAYIRSDRWKALRRKVLIRAAYICEGCGDEKATQVHHLSYEHVGAEFLFELAALCEGCHQRCHAEALCPERAHAEAASEVVEA